MNKSKIRATKDHSLQQVLDGIQEGTFYKDLHCFDTFKPLFGFEYMIVDINAAEFDVDLRWELQEVHIPEKKRGNLGIYAGKTVEIVATTISRGGPRINFYIREKK